MRFSLPSEKRYAVGPRYEEIDRRENDELIHAINLRLVPRAGGGGRGGGGGGGGGGGRGGSGGKSDCDSCGGGCCVGCAIASGNGLPKWFLGGSSGGSRGGVSFSGMSNQNIPPGLFTYLRFLGSSGNRGASAYGRGGGFPTTITSGAFAGRTIGGGTREQVHGTSRYGSGYTYGGGSSVAGRGFPFGYWPIYVPLGTGVGYYGYREYGPANNSSRPGGGMQTALVRSSAWPPPDASGGGGNNTNSTTPVNNATASYYIVGDADSVTAVMEALVASCSVVNTSGTAFDVGFLFRNLRACESHT
jgi:hypothetical protein